jgi:mono/diheme cytochrome c family protein
MQRKFDKVWSWGLLIAVAALCPLMIEAAAAKKNAAASSAEGSAKAGKALFDQNCTLCHFPDQTTTKIGPGLKGLFKNKTLPVSHLPATVANVEHQILNGNPSGKPMPMPPFKSKFSDKDLANLIAYLKTL